SDGGWPCRECDCECLEVRVPREQIISMWEDGWQTLFAAIENLRPGDLEKTVTIRNEPHSVVLALLRNLAHCAYHVGQIVLLAKHASMNRGEKWDFLTIPPGESKTFNREKGM